MLSRRAADYVEHHVSSGKTVEEVVAKRNAAYPDDLIDIAEAQAFFKEVDRLRSGGMQTFTAINLAMEAVAKSKLKVVKGTKKVKKAKSAKSAKK